VPRLGIYGRKLTVLKPVLKVSVTLENFFVNGIPKTHKELTACKLAALEISILTYLKGLARKDGSLNVLIPIFKQGCSGHLLENSLLLFPASCP
jgi:hypothetical protein